MLFVVDHLNNETDKVFVERIYNEYMPMLKQRAYKYVSDMSICEDLAHDCMVNLIKYIDSLKKIPEDKLRVYIAVCIENVVKRYLRKSFKEKTCKNVDLGDNYYLTEDFDVEDEIEQKYDYQTIRTAFDKLCDRDKYIILMKYDLELDDDVIANALMIGKNSVRMTVSRSIKRLKKAIKKLEV